MSARIHRHSRFAGLALSGLVVFVLAGACSLQNQEGPNVSCADLDCGRINACEAGIIAQCVDGKTVKYRVCGSDDICGESWQITGQYKCTEDATDCEGCRPERTGCDEFPTSSSSASSSSAGGAGSTSASGG